tara:strand:- start:51 stop:803 length:753 start_codon:yes stop_codon:yes gene_type:complete
MINENKIKALTLLHKKKERLKHQRYIIEGSRIIEAYLESKKLLDEIYCTNNYLLKNNNLIEKIKNKNIDINLITEKELNRISNTINSSGIIGVCQISQAQNINYKSNIWLYLFELTDPGNIGSLIRSASWFGIKNIAFSPFSIDPYNPKVVRSSMGAYPKVNLFTKIEIQDFKDNDYQLIGADQNSNAQIEQIKISKKKVLVLGSEAHGLDDGIISALDYKISIPRIGFGESLNVAAAGAIIMEKITTKK